MKETVDGLRRGSMIVGPLSEGGRRYLFTVTRVTGKNAVLAVADLGKMTCEINLRTSGINKAESEWKRVHFQDIGDTEFTTTIGHIAVGKPVG